MAAAALLRAAEGQPESLPTIQVPESPLSQPLWSIISSLSQPDPPSVSEACVSFFVLVLFVSLPSVPWETLKGYILPPRDTVGTGPKRAPRISRTPASAPEREGGLMRYLFICLALLGSTPRKLVLPTGEDEKRLSDSGGQGLSHGPRRLISFNSFSIEPNDTVCF